MNEINRQKVLNAIEDWDKTPLYFNGYESKEIKELDLRLSIHRVLELSQDYSSYVSGTDDYECSSGRWRSSFDIWRHIIYYYPDVELFDVMKTIYEIRKELGGQFCDTIERRTFKSQLKRNHEWTNNQSTHGNKDEYGLAWDEWKEI